MIQTVVIGSRGSRLALWQAHYVQDLLEAKNIQSRIEIIKTQGDKIQNVTFDKLEGKGFFTKEIENALLAKKIDLAVHSFKDLPTEYPEGLTIAGNSYRAPSEDWLLIAKESVDTKLKWKLRKNAVVGTSSPRRVAQLLIGRPDLKVVPIRGNVPKRLKKAGEEVDAVVLAGAGIDRLKLDTSAYEVVKFEPTEFIPAPVQGVLAYQIREKDTKTAAIVAKIHNEKVAETVYIERAILNKLEGGCQQPIGVFCRKKEDKFHVWAFYQAEFDVTNPQPNQAFKRVYHIGKNPDELILEVVDVLKSDKKKESSSAET